MNFPVMRTDMKMSKNVDNPIDIYVRDIDRKPVNPAGLLTLRVMERTTRQVVVTVPLVLVDATKSRYGATVSATDLDDVRVGFYDYAVTVQDPSGTESLLFTDRDRTEVSSVEVRQGPFPSYTDPVTILRADLLFRDMISQYSTALAGAAQTRNTSGQSTYVVFGNGFTGTVTPQVSLDAMPTSDDSQWIDLDSQSFDDMTGNQGFTITGLYTWVRFKIVDASAAQSPVTDCGCSCGGCGMGGWQDAETGLVSPIEWPAGTASGFIQIQYRA